MNDIKSLLIETARGVTIPVKVAPRASRSAVIGLHDGAIKVALAAAPVDGAANRELMELLSELLSCPKSSVTVIRGETSKRKVVLVQGLSRLVIEKKLGPLLTKKM